LRLTRFQQVPPPPSRFFFFVFFFPDSFLRNHRVVNLFCWAFHSLRPLIPRFFDLRRLGPYSDNIQELGFFSPKLPPPSVHHPVSGASTASSLFTPLPFFFTFLSSPPNCGKPAPFYLKPQKALFFFFGDRPLVLPVLFPFS